VEKWRDGLVKLPAFALVTLVFLRSPGNARADLILDWEYRGQGLIDTLAQWADNRVGELLLLHGPLELSHAVPPAS
jgi:hypothetical protein